MKKIDYLASILRSPKKILASLSYLVNDEFYWDAYVKSWKRDGANKGFKFVGDEWKNEEVFYHFLDKYLPKDAQAIEIGAGGGKVTSRAAKKAQTVWATDVSGRMLTAAKNALSGYKNIQYKKTDGFTLGGFADESADFVFSHDVFVHFSSLQVYAYLREIDRVLRPGGVGLISFYNFVRHFDLFKEMSVKFWDQKRFPPHMRVHFITEEMLTRMLDDLGFSVLETDKSNFLVIAFQKP